MAKSKPRTKPKARKVAPSKPLTNKCRTCLAPIPDLPVNSCKPCATDESHITAYLERGGQRARDRLAQSIGEPTSAEATAQATAQALRDWGLVPAHLY